MDQLGWQEELWRRRLLDDPLLTVPDDAPEPVRDLAAMACGDPLALQRLVVRLDGKSRKLVQHVLASRDEPAGWPKALFTDTALWPLLESLCGQAVINNTASTEVADFVAWRDLRAAHRDLLDVNPAAYDRIKPHLHSSRAWVQEEAAAMEVYLNLRFSEPGESGSLHAALRTLGRLSKRSPITEANLAWVRTQLRTDRNHRGPLFNPYLELGVSHGAPQEKWREAWRRLRRKLQGRREELSDINHARDLIRDMEATGGESNHPQYVLPVHADKLFPRPCVPARFITEPRPIARGTAPLSGAARERIRLDALTSLLHIAASERTQ
ncbi:hypothetical protein HFP72_04435 [Nocardiopsis sp. ARC36]